eukprot:TRINITY_DN5022_c0_g1_i2.p1 TRINITY_DN5022_c0_g1~~TRINITY_DN5022_c0_g1_i2.p1  ORF type:complete len:116 (-),score=2.73 TRINITY_DN5022_c0_g1_i2:80-427(-)
MTPRPLYLVACVYLVVMSDKDRRVSTYRDDRGRTDKEEGERERERVRSARHLQNFHLELLSLRFRGQQCLLVDTDTRVIAIDFPGLLNQVSSRVVVVLAQVFQCAPVVLVVAGSR